MKTILVPVAAILVLVCTMSARGQADRPTDETKRAIEKSLPLLWKGAEGHAARKTCFACHNQGIPILAFATARERGLSVRETDLKKQLDFIAAFLTGNKDSYREGKGQGGQVDTAGYALFALELGGWKPDATTEAVTEYLLLRDKDIDHWRSSGNRPPSEESDFTPTYFAIRALRKWGAPEQKERITKRIDRVRAWLLKTPARDTEERVFRLWALQSSGVEAREILLAINELLESQQEDGGWSQTDTMTSDAYATGTVLVALNQAVGLATSEPAYQRGAAFLLKNQRADGSWLVPSRSKPFQTYFESGFPHGKDQFISMAASGWATTALVLTCPPATKLPK